MRQSDAEQALDKQNRRVGEFLAAISAGIPPKGLVEGLVTAVSIRMPSEADPGTLLVVKATDEAGDHVAFVGGLTLTQALLSWRAREVGPGLRWREDIPWGQR